MTLHPNGAKFDGVTDDSLAIQRAIDSAAADGGGVVLLPPGTAIIGTALVPKDRVTVRGAGMGATVLKQAGANRIFSRTYVAGANLEQVAFEDFTTLGLWESTPGLGGDSERHFAIDGVNHLVVHRVESKFCRQMALSASYCEEISVTDCRVLYCARDAINLSASRRCIVTGNHIRHVADDAIAVHQTGAAGNPPAEGHVISGNVVEDSYGIKGLGMTKGVISGNTLRRVKGYGVFISDEGVEGYNDIAAVLIASNTITDVINANKFGGGIVAHGIYIAGSATSFAPPVVGGTPPTITKPEALGYLSNAVAAQNAGGLGVSILGNTIVGATLPAAAEYDDCGYGQAFTASGWTNPSLATGFHFNANGITLAGALLSVAIRSNHIEFVGAPVQLASNIVHIGDLVVQGNTLRRYASHGVSLETSATKYGRALVEGNVFDGDPLFEHANRTAGPDGTWSIAGQQPTAIDYVNFRGVSILSNTFRNLNQVAHTNAVSLGSFDGNVYAMEPASGASLSAASASSKGIRVPSGIASGGMLTWEDSTPTSATYGQELGRSAAVGAATTMPAAGHYLAGSFVRNLTGFGTSTQTLGWQRLTTGSAHVSGTDWRVVQITGA